MKLPYLIDVIAVGVFAVSGCLAAGRKSLDLVGVFVVAVVTAVGGGTLRDLLLDRHPIFWIADANFLYVIAAAVVATLLYVRVRAAAGPDPADCGRGRAVGVRHRRGPAHRGPRAAGGRGRGPGTLTATAGGVFRDLLCNDIPILFREGYLYATAAAAGAACYVLTEDPSAGTGPRTWGWSWWPCCGSGRSCGNGTCRGSSCASPARRSHPATGRVG